MGEGATLASALAGSTASIVSADVALDSAEPVVGSFTADGLTYAVGPDGLMLVSVDASALADGAIAIPATVSYDGTAYDVVAIGPYAFYLSGATSVGLPASIASVDSRALRSCDVERVEVDSGNPNLASYDGALYAADLSRLLLIPGGRGGAVRIPDNAEEVPAAAFSHCAQVDAVSVDGGSPAFSSWEGLLYDASGQTLLRVPAGATEITIRDGCTTIAAGAMEGCAKLERITAPASVTSISPDVFESVPTVSLPAQMAVQDEASSSVASSLLDQANASTGSVPQLTAMVALSSADDNIPEVDPSSIEVTLPESTDAMLWQALGFAVFLENAHGEDGPIASIRNAVTYADGSQVFLYAPGGRVFYYNTQNPNPGPGSTHGWKDNGCGVYFPESAYLSGGKLWWRAATSESYFRWFGVNNTTGGVTSAVVRDAANGKILFTANGTARVIPYGDLCLNGARPTWTVTWEANGGACDVLSSTPFKGEAVMAPQATKEGCVFKGWFDAPEGGKRVCGPGESTAAITSATTYYAQWEPCEISFDTDSEPDDTDYPGEAKDSISAPDAVGPDGTIAIEDPKRPGYVFEGWVIPTEDGTEAVDQDLVYQGDDGKWYVDASKLPDYAGDDGRVELTARWTSVISVDVPSSVTFYADLVTQGQESREGAASGAFGQSKVENQSQVDLRVVGLESSAVKTTDSTLGADSILKKADAATPSTSTQKLLSLYPSTKQWTADELQDPDAVGGSKAATAVDFDLDDILLEKSFKADDFTIAAGDTLNMGYRLNLAETGQQLDYDKLSTLEEGQSASIANVSYTFAAEAHFPTATGTKDDPLWIEYEGRIYGLQDIKDSAECISKHGIASPCYDLYKRLLDAQITNNGNPGIGPYFKVKIGDVYWDLQLIGIYQDVKSADGEKAGLTFQTRDLFAVSNTVEHPGKGAYPSQMNSANTNSGGWELAFQRNQLRTVFASYLDANLQTAIVPVNKAQQLYGGKTVDYLQQTVDETIWLPSMYEVLGTTIANCNESEALVARGYTPFQYMAFQPGGASMRNTYAIKRYYANATSGIANRWWFRSVYRNTGYYFCGLNDNGALTDYNADQANRGVAPCFCL